MVVDVSAVALVRSAATLQLTPKVHFDSEPPGQALNRVPSIQFVGHVKIGNRPFAERFPQREPPSRYRTD